MIKYVETAVTFSEIPKRTWSVYLHIFPSKKIYVGITSKSPQKRWGFLGHNYNRGHHIILANAINKYGWSNIKHIILCKTTEENAKLLEKTLIKYYKKKNLSYNITDGGDGTCGFSKVPWNKGIPCSESTKNKISIANNGKISYWKNRHLPEETRNKISKTRLERGIKGTINTSIITYLYKDGSLVKEFKSGAEVARYFGISSAYINNCIKHNRSYKGFKIIQKDKGC